MQFFATCPSGFADLLEAELGPFGAEVVTRSVTGVGFVGELECAYRACLWSRVANRVLLELDRFSAVDGDALYAGVGRIDWRQHLRVDQTLGVDFTSRRSQLTHSLYGAQRVKDAVVDQLRTADGSRPGVDVRFPDVRINVHVDRDVARIAIDLAGDSLHRRGYRTSQGLAPLKENLAAALLLRAGWPEIAAAGGALLDPMCGSGTLLIEGALMAAGAPPGLDRAFGFERWLGHQDPMWQRLRDEGNEQRQRGLESLTNLFRGSDCDVASVGAARDNVASAGLSDLIEIAHADFTEIVSPAAHGLLITNPPYGERLAQTEDPAALFTALGELLRSRFVGWRAAVLAPDAELGFRIGLRVRKKNAARNGALNVVLLTFDVSPERALPPRNDFSPPKTLDPGIEDFSNRLRKNIQRLTRWARKEGVTCYRIYDADLPDYAFAIDRYEGERVWLHVQEYAPPAIVDEARAQLRRDSLLAVLPELLGIAPADVFFKTRKRQRGSDQYARTGDDGELFEVVEDGCRLLVNFTDYLDTGLFLDHRPLRMRLQRESRDVRFLNLFCYTASATVHAIRGGARQSVSVDLSRAYIDWARLNFERNRADLERHELVRADCRDWLRLAAKRGAAFDLILLDPPSFSNSKSSDAELVIQRDHVALIRACCAVLAPAGTLYFSTNLQRFKFDVEALADLAVADITTTTIAEDFKRNPRIHACWRIRH
jgi:23S rRNA (guanine2445-N2)-methyltransferase / 23S rRNA (guanine2069-N7)-methyltransferase